MPSRQSMAASPAAETMTTSSDSTTRGSTWAAASLILRESSATRETRSPVPVTSMRWDSKLSAESTTSVRSPATTGMAIWASAQPPIHVPKAMTMPATATATAQNQTSSGPAPAGSRSTRQPIAHGPTSPAPALARPATVRRAIQPIRRRSSGPRWANDRRREAIGRVL